MSGAPPQPNPMHQMPQQPQPMMPQPIQQHQPMPQPSPAMMQNPQQNAHFMMTQKYMQQANNLLPSCTEKNPHLKQQVGQMIFPYIGQMIGQQHQPRVPKITGMLIDLPINDIQLILQNYDLFKTRVGQASDLLSQQQNS